jgi:hypothetical protein
MTASTAIHADSLVFRGPNVERTRHVAPDRVARPHGTAKTRSRAATMSTAAAPSAHVAPGTSGASHPSTNAFHCAPPSWAAVVGAGLGVAAADASVEHEASTAAIGASAAVRATRIAVFRTATPVARLRLRQPRRIDGRPALAWTVAVRPVARQGIARQSLATGCPFGTVTSSPSASRWQLMRIASPNSSPSSSTGCGSSVAVSIPVPWR